MHCKSSANISFDEDPDTTSKRGGDDGDINARLNDDATDARRREWRRAIHRAGGVSQTGEFLPTSGLEPFAHAVRGAHEAHDGLRSGAAAGGLVSAVRGQEDGGDTRALQSGRAELSNRRPTCTEGRLVRIGQAGAIRTRRGTRSERDGRDGRREDGLAERIRRHDAYVSPARLPAGMACCQAEQLTHHIVAQCEHARTLRTRACCVQQRVCVQFIADGEPRHGRRGFG